MRIVGGEWRGRKLAAPEGREVARPTTDRTREAIASMVDAALPAGIAGSRVLDAFAGSGALGIELLSRGAAHATLCDIDRRAVAVIRANLAQVRCEAPRFDVLSGDALVAAERGRMPGAPFDVVLLDPPYALGCAPAEALVPALAAAGLLAPAALVVFERAAGKTPALVLPGFENVREKRYGTAAVDLLRRRADTGA